ncbi:aminotransferase class V-fold PLP-dependent enzyme [Helicobacter baculiformis]|uniref:Aminotransferase class V-fold PLP-dependent enzyme n=1 Tax=Helicobacter baculiformis TaxID=427351 RepID=A0ABV7ZHA7_9HELI|nr:aminotransferase class V-fold PLP-dependent enzyme [Helicobacter baculiformis]
MDQTLLDPKDSQRFLAQAFAPLLKAQPKARQLTCVRESLILKKGVRYFDWTASGLASTLIEKRVLKLLPFYANAHSEFSKHAALMQQVYLESKARIKQSLGLSEDFVVLASGFGASHAIKRFQEILGIYIPPKTRQVLGKLKGIALPRVIIGPYEHHSNEISWREGLCEVVRLELDAQGLFSLQNLEQALQEAQKNARGFAPLVSVGVASNVTGMIVPYKEIAKLCARYQARLAFDAAAFSPHDNLEVLDFDALFLSAHKLLGGVGACGILGVKRDLIDNTLPPSFSGGGVVKYVSRSTQEYVDNPDVREEVGTYGLVQLFRAALALQLRNEIGMSTIRRRESMLSKVFMHALEQIPAVQIYGNTRTPRLGNVAFNASGVSCYTLARFLSHQFGIETRAGCSCAGPYGHDLLDMEDSSFCTLQEKGLKPGWLRVSLHYSHTLEDVDFLVDRISKAIQTLRGG